MLMFFVAGRRRHTRCALVTGVQTCALPISCLPDREREVALRRLREADPDGWDVTRGALEEARRQYRSLGFCLAVGAWHRGISSAGVAVRSDERSGGTEGVSTCRSWWSLCY